MTPTSPSTTRATTTSSTSRALVNLGTSVSNDDGNTWRKNPLAVQNVAVDRQWYAIDNGPTTSAADNTIFMGFHETAVGTFIYSSPGTTGPTDPVGGLVWQSASAKAPLPLAADATCGQLRFDPKYRNLYSACNEGDHVRLTIGHVAPGQRTGIQFHNVTLPVSPGGGGPGHLFPALAVDSRRQRLRGLDRRQRQRRLLLVLGRPGRELDDAGSRQHRSVDDGRVPLGAGGRRPGTLALAWYATDTAGQPDSFPSWANDPQGATAVKWWGYAATIANAASLSPTIAQERFTEKPMHYGQICNQGIGCTVSSGDRTMADYFALNLDKTRLDPDRLQRHDEPEPRRAPVRGPPARRQDGHRQAGQRPRAEEPDEGRSPATPSGRTTRRSARARTSRSST